MVFTDRENFIVASVIMVVSDSMKKVPRQTRTNILQFIRETKYKSITDKDWKEIADGINAHKKDVFGTLVTAFNEKTPHGDKAMIELDNSMKVEIDDIDFDELKSIVDSSDDPKLREYYLTMKQLKREFDDKQ